MEYHIKTNLSLQSTLDPNFLDQILGPENADLTKTSITTQVTPTTVEITMEGRMKIGTVIATIDDILKTTYLAQEVAERTLNPIDKADQDPESE